MVNIAAIFEKNVNSPCRLSLWERVLDELRMETVCEVGVFRGEFAARMLRSCGSIRQYYMIDPWAHLDAWHKPANRTDEEFVAIHATAMAVTDFAAPRRVVLRGTTAEMSGKIEDGALDAVYVDGDHTLRGITIDLHRMLPKVKHGGILGGDDFCPNIWQHGPRFAPSEVFPYAMYFAEAHSLPIITLPWNQFAIVNDSSAGYQCLDLGGYAALTLQDVYLSPMGPG